MNILKRKAVLIAVALAVFTAVFANVSADGYYMNEAFEAMPGMWEVSVNNGSAGANGGQLVMSYDTTASAARGKSEITTDSVELDNDILCISFSESTDVLNAGAMRKIILTDDDDWGSNDIELLSIENEKPVVLKTEISQSVQQETRKWEYYMNFADKNNVQAYVRLNGEKVYDGVIGSTGINTKMLRFWLRNNTVGQRKLSASWSFDFIKAYGEGALSVTANVAEGEAVQYGSLNALTVEYKGILTDVLNKDSFSLTKNGSSVLCTAEVEGQKVTVAPDSGLEPGNYTLALQKVNDIFGNQSDIGKITFSVVSPDYKLPEITLTAGGSTDIKEGGNVVMTAAAATDYFERAEFSVNGTVEYAAYSKESIFELKKNAGSYAVSATVYDTYGNKGVSDVVTVNVSENDSPSVTVGDGSSVLRLNASEALNVSVLAVDSDGIDKIELVCGNEVFCTINSDSGTADFSVLGSGSFTVIARAYDSYGKTGETTVNVTLYSEAFSEIYSDSEFEYREAGNTLNFNNAVAYPRIGLIDSVDSTKGKSLRIGIDTPNEAFTSSDYPYFVIPLSVSNGERFAVSMSFMFDQRPADSQNSRSYLQVFKNSTSSTSAVGVYLVQFGENITIGSQSFEYDVNKWYDLYADIDLAGKTYTVVLYDSDGVSRTAGGRLPSTLTMVNSARICGPSNENTPYYGLYDDIVINKVVNSPVITGFSAGELPVSELIIPSVSVIKAYLSAPLYSVTPEQVSLAEGSLPVGIDKVGYDRENGVIWIYPKSPLKENTVYTVKINGEAQMLPGKTLGLPVCGNFKTRGSGNISLGGAVIKKSGQGVSISVAADNTAATSDSVLLVATVTENGKVLSTAAKSFELSAGEQLDLNMKIEQLLSGQNVEFYVLNGVFGGNVLMIQQYKNN